ncbi:MAG TPA: EamA family transporter [bacterium]|nr:EamA family transporter [bacterium]
MTTRDAVLASLTSVIWGLAFVAVKFGLQSFSAPELTAVRFLLACLPALVIPRPRLPWWSIVVIGLTLFTGQFLLLFFAYTRGLPPGLASVTQQTQAFFTVLLAAAFLHDVPSPRQWLGMAIAFAGLALIGSTVGSDFSAAGLALGLGGALSWAVGNVLVKRAVAVPIFPLVVWASLIPPVPSLIVSVVSDRRVPVVHALAHASWPSIIAALYLGVFATVIAYAIWGDLLQRYPTAVVAPFALLAPCTGVVASAVIFGEMFGPARYAGMALILAGLAVVIRAPAAGTGTSPAAMRARSP